MYIGKKDEHIVAFNTSQEELLVNAKVKGITFDSIEQTDEEIVPYYNTPNDGYYFKISEIPDTPTEVVNELAKNRRREMYRLQSDPITNNISVLRDVIEQGDFATEGELEAIKAEISGLYQDRKVIRQQIIDDNPLSK